MASVAELCRDNGVFKGKITAHGVSFSNEGKFPPGVEFEVEILGEVTSRDDPEKSFSPFSRPVVVTTRQQIDPNSDEKRGWAFRTLQELGLDDEDFTRFDPEHDRAVDATGKEVYLSAKHATKGEKTVVYFNLTKLRFRPQSLGKNKLTEIQNQLRAQGLLPSANGKKSAGKGKKEPLPSPF